MSHQTIQAKRFICFKIPLEDLSRRFRVKYRIFSNLDPSLEDIHCIEVFSNQQAGIKEKELLEFPEMTSATQILFIRARDLDEAAFLYKQQINFDLAVQFTISPPASALGNSI